MIRFDGVRYHLDAIGPNATLYFARQLESIEPVLYEFKQPELKYRLYIPVSNRDNPGAETVTYRMYGKTGLARIIANYSNNPPRVDVFGKEFTQKVKGVGVSFGYNTQELRAAMFANVPLDTAKVSAARRALREQESRIAWNGNSEYNMMGLLNNPNIPVISAPAGVGGTKWSDKTPDEIIADITTMVSGVRSQSKGVHSADTLLLPIPQYDLIATKPRATYSDKTILQFIKEPGNSFGLTTVDWLPFELTNAFVGGTKDGALCYQRSGENAEQRIPLELIMHPVQVQGYEFVIPGESRHGGVVVRYPLSMNIMTGI